MLQIDKSLAATAPDHAEGTPELSAAELLASVIGFARRQVPVVAFVLVLVVSLGAVYLFTTPPRYTGHVALIIDSHKIQLFQQQSVLGDVPVDSATVESQV